MEFGKKFVQTYGALYALAREWRKFEAVFRLQIRKHNSANSIINWSPSTVKILLCLWVWQITKTIANELQQIDNRKGIEHNKESKTRW